MVCGVCHVWMKAPQWEPGMTLPAAFLLLYARVSVETCLQALPRVGVRGAHNHRGPWEGVPCSLPCPMFFQAGM